MLEAGTELRQFTLVRYDPPSPSPLGWGLGSGCVGGGLLLFAAGLAAGLQPAEWFQPTAVGILWGSIFLAGFTIGGPGRGRLAGATLAGCLAYLALLAFGALTAIAWAESLLLASLLMLFGWSIALLDPLCAPPEDGPPAADSRLRMGRCSIWDLAFLTLLAACICHAVPALQAPKLLLLSVLVAMGGGLFCSWIACRWVWHDAWSLWQLSGMTIALIVGVGCVWRTTPAGLTLVHALQWALAGPLSVIAAQGITVVVALACWRLDRFQAGQA